MTHTPGPSIRPLNVITALWRNDRGATAIEYALIASLIAMAIIGALTNLSGSMDSMYNTIDTAIQ